MGTIGHRMLLNVMDGIAKESGGSNSHETSELIIRREIKELKWRILNNLRENTSMPNRDHIIEIEVVKNLDSEGLWLLFLKKIFILL